MDKYVDLSNFILESGFYPDIWRDNVIKPICKGEETLDPSNYRGIAVVLVSFSAGNFSID